MSDRPKRAILAGLPEAPSPHNPIFAGDPESWRIATAEWMNNIATELEKYSQINDRPTNDPFTVSNLTVTRTFDADSTSTAELADVLGTLIADLQSKGVMS